MGVSIMCAFPPIYFTLEADLRRGRGWRCHPGVSRSHPLPSNASIFHGKMKVQNRIGGTSSYFLFASLTIVLSFFICLIRHMGKNFEKFKVQGGFRRCIRRALNVQHISSRTQTMPNKEENLQCCAV